MFHHPQRKPRTPHASSFNSPTPSPSRALIYFVVLQLSAVWLLKSLTALFFDACLNRSILIFYDILFNFIVPLVR